MDLGLYPFLWMMTSHLQLVLPQPLPKIRERERLWTKRTQSKNGPLSWILLHTPRQEDQAAKNRRKRLCHLLPRRHNSLPLALCSPSDDRGVYQSL